MTLLMVNDAVLTVESMKNEICWEEYKIDQVYVAYNVIEGQNIINSSKIDILLCDIEMPGENGIQLIRWIRNHHFDIDCVLLTCHADFNYAQEAITLNCQDYLLIPASYASIGETVLKVVQRRIERLNNSKLQEYGRSWLEEKNKKIYPESELVKSPRDVVAKCVAYIISRLSNEELSVSEIASHFYLNPIYLNRIFKKEKGISISQFIIHEKMELAGRLLQNPANSTIAVSNQVGYPNYSYFTTIFKKHYGCTITQYRAKYVGNRDMPNKENN